MSPRRVFPNPLNASDVVKLDVMEMWKEKGTASRPVKRTSLPAPSSGNNEFPSVGLEIGESMGSEGAAVGNSEAELGALEVSRADEGISTEGRAVGDTELEEALGAELGAAEGSREDEIITTVLPPLVGAIETRRRVVGE